MQDSIQVHIKEAKNDTNHNTYSEAIQLSHKKLT